MPGPRRNPAAVDKPKNFKKTTKKLISSYLAKYKIALLVVFIFAIGSTIFTIVGPKILGNATTEVFNRNSQQNIWRFRNRLWKNS